MIKIFYIKSAPEGAFSLDGKILSVIIYCLLLLSALNSYAIDEKILVLPPSGESGKKDFQRTNTQWIQLLNIYANAILYCDLIPPEDVIEFWSGDTLNVTSQEFDRVLEIGNGLEADRVIQLCWDNGEYLLQSIQPWDGTVLSILRGDDSHLLVQKLENERYIYGFFLDAIPPDYVQPALPDGEWQISDELHATKSYPSQAVIEMVQAIIEVEVKVSNNGTPVSARIIKCTPMGWGFEDAAMQVLMSVHYLPATVGAKPVAGLFKDKIKLHYEPVIR